MKRQRYLIVALVLVAAEVLIIWGLTRAGGAWWWDDALEPRLRPLYHLLSSAWLVAGVLWLARVFDSWGKKQRSEKLWLLNACIVVGFGLFAGTTATFAEARLQVHHVDADRNTIIALTQDQRTVWSENFASTITHVLQPEDLDMDGVLEIVLATSPRGSASSKLLILDERGRIIFDSDYIVSVRTDEPPYRADVPYEDLVIDGQGRVLSVRKPSGEVTDTFSLSDLWNDLYIPDVGLPGGTYQVVALLADNVDESPGREIVYAANARYLEGFSLIGKLSPTGKPIGAYWHPGPIQELTVLEGTSGDMANIVAAAENSFLEDHESFDVVFGLSGHLLTRSSCWNLLTPSDLSLSYGEQLEKVPGVALCRGYHEALRWFRWISPSGVRVSEIATSYRPLWKGPKLGLGGSEPTIDLTLSDGSYFGLDAWGEVLYTEGAGNASLKQRQ